VQGNPTDFWGKLRRAEDGRTVAEWHPLYDHCADVAAVTEALLALPLWRRRLSRLAGQDLDEVLCARLSVLAALHDIGKFNLGFQAKGLPELGPTAGHVAEGLAALAYGGVLGCLASLEEWGDGTLDLLVASMCHHGRPIRVEAAGSSWQRTWWSPRRGFDPIAGVVGLLDRCRRSWFHHAFRPGARLALTPNLTHAFAGLVMLTDWLASDTRLFPFTRTPGADRMEYARSVAPASLRALGLSVDLADRCDPFRRDAFTRVIPEPFSPRGAQRAMLELPLNDQGSIAVLEAETGSGKTEAALAYFVRLFEAGLVDGMYFALPTRSAATQLYRRVCTAARQAFAAPPPVILAVPGYLSVDDQSGKRLPPFEVLWPDRDRLRYRGWAAENSKRYLAGSIAVGTVDQVLLSALMVGHAHLRATALLRQLLVVDEVHASDAYMEQVLRYVLARHLAAGGHTLLLSATLGAEARERLLHPFETRTMPSRREAEATAYPNLTWRFEAVGCRPIQQESRQREIRVLSKPWMEDPAAIAEAVWHAVARGAKVLVVRNTVSDCVDTQCAVEAVAEANGAANLLFSCEGVPAPHHARFAKLDREALDTALEQRFGKRRADGGCVVVATQTVQQSLDIDADILFSDLCPADILLQRAGRVHRHERTRPAAFAVPQVVVLVPSERDLGRLILESGAARGAHGLGTVYDDLRVLEATWRLLEAEGHWRIPEMNRHLVEGSLHSSVLAAIVGQLGGRWQAHAESIAGQTFGQKRQAALNVVDWSRPYADTGFPDRFEQRIGTRLGEGDRRVTFSGHTTGPFGRDLWELRIPPHWAAGVEDECTAADDVRVEGGAVSFRFGHRAFLYDRLGLRPASSGGRSDRKEEPHDDGP